jgi:hypothetical protein
MLVALVPATCRHEASKLGQALLRAIRADRVNVEPVGLGEGLRHARFNLRGEAGEKGESGGSEEGSDTHGGKIFL